MKSTVNEKIKNIFTFCIEPFKGSLNRKKLISKVHFSRYFQRLVENFETQMLSYRQQIETLEGHLHSISQPSILSPEGKDKVTASSFF